VKCSVDLLGCLFDELRIGVALVLSHGLGVKQAGVILGDVGRWLRSYIQPPPDGADRLLIIADLGLVVGFDALRLLVIQLREEVEHVQRLLLRVEVMPVRDR